MIRKSIRKIRRALSHWYKVYTDDKPKLIVLTYHRILLEVKFNPFSTIISLKTFVKQIDILSKKYPIISLSDAIRQCKSGCVKAKTQVVLTFDDGYRDNYEVIFPILKQKGVPATFFLVTDYINSDKTLWDWEIILILYNDKTISSVKIENQVICQEMRESRLCFAFRVIDKMKSIGVAERQNIIDFLKERSQNKLTPDYTKDSFMTWEQVKKMSEDGMEVGAHSLSHRSLARIPYEEAVNEIKRSKQLIENNIKKDCLHFAFPFGSKKDYNQFLIDSVKNARYQTCLLNIYGYNHIIRDTFCYKRIAMDEYTNPKYLLGGR